MAKQRILLTAMPRSVSIDPQSLPLSVLVSPRLTEADALGSFPDWLAWTELVSQHGLRLTLESGGRAETVQVATAGLRPDLWAALFNANTLVRPHVFEDYRGRSVFSYPVRLALSALKGTHQRTAFDLALPEPEGALDERGQRHRRALAAMLDGLGLDWDESRAPALREKRRTEIAAMRPAARARPGTAAEHLGRDGLILPARIPAPGSVELRAWNQQIAGPFGVFSHPPQGPALEDLPPPDWNRKLDFHQVLSALNNYPVLQRALGLVFDIDVPLELVPAAAGNPVALIAVTQIVPGWNVALQPEVPRLETAVVHGLLENRQRVFFTASPGDLPVPAGELPRRSDFPIIGLLRLDPAHYGLAQVDVDGALHKNIMLSETLSGRHGPPPLVPPHVQVFDPSATLPALRSGGLSLFADGRAMALMDRFADSATFNAALDGATPVPFCDQDLIRGYRIDVWDSRTGHWHSVHRRRASYVVADAAPLTVADEEGFIKLAATQAPPDPQRAERADDFYLHEALARWTGWSLSAPMPGKHLSRFGDPQRALPKPGEEGQFVENEAPTPFRMRTQFQVVPGTLPRLRFGTRYRLRARAVDLAGNSLASDALIADRFARDMALPPDPDGNAYLRFEPVAAPQMVVRDAAAITRPGGELERLVIRTFNAGEARDAVAADLGGSDRHVAPPRTSVEVGERLGMFDDADGTLIASDAMHALIAQREKGEFQQTAAPVTVAGQEQTFPLEPAARLDQAPYLPDPLARGAALRDVPGLLSGTIGSVKPGVGTNGPVPHRALDDPNPRPGSVLLVDFGGGGDWQKMRPFRLALGDGSAPPSWDPIERVLTLFLPKGTISIVPLSSYLGEDDLKLMGVWEWLREYIETRAATPAPPEPMRYGLPVTQVAHVLQRALEGGHWMLTPPRLLTLVHAVQQPVGTPAFTAVALQHPTAPDRATTAPAPLQPQPEGLPTPEAELASITAWRRPNALDAFLVGALRIHGSSTEKVDIVAEWEDPVDDPALGPPHFEQRQMPVDELPIDSVQKPHVLFSRATTRAVGYYVPLHDLVVFAARRDCFGHLVPGIELTADSAPRHHIGDTRHHLVRYSAIGTSRFRDYFEQDLDFTRRSAPIEVSVPASGRPLAPCVLYAIPLLGWQRNTSSSLKHSVRFGGAIRIYLERGWYSSGRDELLGVVLWHANSGGVNREAWKPFISQWGIDPIWDSTNIGYLPSIGNFNGQAASDSALTLEENTPRAPGGGRGVVDVVGFPVKFDAERDLRYCDVTLNPDSTAYMPFVRLALARYQPHALSDAKLSRVVLADFVQLTPDRSAVITSDPAHPRQLGVTVSGPAPRGPTPAFADAPAPDPVILTPTAITVTVQQRDPAVLTDLGWINVADPVVRVVVHASGPAEKRSDLTLWRGSVQFTDAPERNRFRLLIEEYEYISSNYTLLEEVPGAAPLRRQPRRLIYAETILLDSAVTAEAAQPTSGEGAPAPVDEWPASADAPYGPFGGPPTVPPGAAASLPQLPGPAPLDVDGYVKLLQATLNGAGALPASMQALKIDGKFGGETESAVRNFQRSHLLPVTGMVDALTWHALTLAAPFPLLEPGLGDPAMQGPPIAALQRALNLVGAFPPVDGTGVFDALTSATLADFQQQRSLAPTGATDPATWFALATASADTEPVGSMVLTFMYDVTLEPPVQFASRVDVDAHADETDPIEGSAIGRAGYVVELHDANDQPIYRQLLADPFGLRIEGFVDSAELESDQRGIATATPTPGALVLTLPRLPNAVQVVFVGSPLDPERMTQAAGVLARFAIADLE